MARVPRSLAAKRISTHVTILPAIITAAPAPQFDGRHDPSASLRVFVHGIQRMSEQRSTLSP
jgi:hypothetical protein